MTRGLRPRRLVHRGVVRARAVLLPRALVPREEAARRILVRWRRGARVRDSAAGLVLELATTEWLDTAGAWGVPLVREGEWLSAAPLAPDEQRRLGDPGLAEERWVWVQAGEAHLVPLGEEVDPSRWLELGQFRVVGAPALGGATALPSPPASRSFDPRAQLAALPPPPREREEALAALQAAASAPAARSPGRWIRWLGSLLRTLAGQLGGRAATTPAAAAVAPARPPSALARWLARWADRLLSGSALYRLLARRHAEYLARMMALFQERDLSEALRHAIPLSRRSAEGSRPGLPLRLPAPRQTLELGAPANGGGQLMLQSDLFAELRRMYRRAFQQLATAGRIREAAFVLAELLEEIEEAVDFLERNGEPHLAAALAEARGLAPGRVVRLWFLAGETARAVAYARRHRAFADAVLHLERSTPGEPSPLRLLWADWLASTGDYLGAIEALWPVEAARHLARPWLEAALEVGGDAGARALARGPGLFPAEEARFLAGARALLAEPGEGAAELRLQLADQLLREAQSPAVQRMAAQAVRALLADAATTPVNPGRPRFDRLVRLAGDPVLRADLAPLPAPRPIQAQALRVRLGRANAGTLPIHDAARLPRGRALLALGELGVRLINADGRTVAHFDVPAERLVLADRRDRAIALMPRGDQTALSRIDLAYRRASRWCELPLATWAADFDGEVWWAATAQEDRYELLLLEAAQTRLATRWRTECEPALAMGRAGDEAWFVVGAAQQLERWTIESRELTLRQRTPRPARPGLAPWTLGLSPAGAVGELSLRPPEADQLFHMWGQEPLYLGAHHGEVLRQVLERCFVTSLTDESGVEVMVRAQASGESWAFLDFEGSARVAVHRGNHTHLLLSDDRGRLAELDVEGRALTWRCCV